MPGTLPSNPTPALSLSAKAQRTHEQPISFLIALAMHRPEIINLAAGLVDPQTLPVEECAKISEKLFGDVRRGRVALQYDTTLGLGELRRAVLHHLESLEGKSAASMGLSPDDVVVTTGSQQALYLIGDVLLDPGDIVIAANPSYFVFTGTLQSLGANVMTVPMKDPGGMDVDAVEQLLARLERDGQLSRVKMVYCTSYFQNPTGLTLSAGSRPRLLEIVRRFSKSHRILILEDAAYRELRYDGADLPSIKSYDAENRYTILAQTFSKPFAPGIKTGYTFMPKDLMHALLQQKGNHDFGSANVVQHVALEALKSGMYQSHVEVLRCAYRAKRDAMLAALDRSMPKSDDVHWTHPDGGLYVWVTLPKSIDTSRDGAMFSRCVERGVLYVPGDYCMQADELGKKATNCLRLSFGQVAVEQIAPGIERLAEVIADLLKKTAKPQAAETRMVK